MFYDKYETKLHGFAFKFQQLVISFSNKSFATPKQVRKIH